MFHNCHNMLYLDISNFSPLDLRVITYMLRNMTSLIFLNMGSLEIMLNTTKDSSLQYIAKNLTICSTGQNMKSYLSEQKFVNNNCSDICFIKDIKVDTIKKECIYSCKDNGYEYEKNNICYEQCPEYSHAIFKNKENNINDNEVSLCLDKKPEGYYLSNDSFYHKCYDSCKNCDGPGNEKDNNCIECISGYLFLNESLITNNLL